MKKSFLNGREIFARNIANKRVVFNIYKKLLQTDEKKKMSGPIEKPGRILDPTFQNGNYEFPINRRRC